MHTFARKLLNYVGFLFRKFFQSMEADLSLRSISMTYLKLSIQIRDCLGFMMQGKKCFYIMNLYSICGQDTTSVLNESSVFPTLNERHLVNLSSSMSTKPRSHSSLCNIYTLW